MSTLIELSEQTDPHRRPIDTKSLMGLLQARYPKGEYAFFREVPNATGAGCNRHCDALAMSLWPSRGLYLTGFELKASRADWMKELKQPAKAESIAQYCDYWFLVVGSKDIVHIGELPPNWGLLAPVGGKLKVVTEATKLEPLELSRKFIAALMRVTQEQASAEAINYTEKLKEYQRGQEDGRKSRDYEVSKLQRTIDRFEEEAGVKLTEYNAGSLVQAMQLIKKDGALVDGSETG
jgi:hypothetical protein